MLSSAFKVNIVLVQALHQENEVVFGGRQGPYRSPVNGLT